MKASAVEALIPDLSERLRQLVAQQRLPGLAVGIVQDQQLVWSAGFGHADRESGRTPDEHTLFRVASITKTFTAACILQLRDEGRLSLDDPLQRHLPEFSGAVPRAGTVAGVTLRRLLSHHSGVTTEAPLPCWDSLEFPDRESLLAAIPQMEIVIPQESAFKYSNLAFGLLGEVITRVSGISYDEYLRSRVLEPLGMTSSALELDDTLRPRLAVGYYPSLFDDELRRAPNVPLQGLAACGQLHSSVHDLAAWLSLQFRTGELPRGGSQVLAGTTIEESHRPQYLEPDWSVGYCLGWRGTRNGDHIYHGHGGGIHGFASYVLFSKPHKIGVICLANLWPHPGIYPVACEIAEQVLAASSSQSSQSTAVSRSLVPTPPQLLELLGFYEATSGVFASIAFRDGSLRLEKTALSEYQLHTPAVLEPTSVRDTYVVRGSRGSGEQIQFKCAADGSVLTFALGGFVYRRFATVGSRAQHPSEK